MTGQTAKTIKVTWNTNCADEEIAELATLKSQDITYFESPDSLKCGAIRKVEGKMQLGLNQVDCTALGVVDSVDPANIYIKTDLADTTKCVIETNAKNANY